MAWSFPALADLDELGTGDFDAEQLTPVYGPQAYFRVTEWWQEGYCGIVTVLNVVTPHPWQVNVTLNGKIRRFGGGHYVGAIGRPYNLELWPEPVSIGPAGAHEFYLCAEGRELLVIHSVMSRKGLTYDPVPIAVVSEGMHSNATHNDAKRGTVLVANSERELARIESLVGHSLKVAMDRFTVIAVFMGQMGTSGYSVEIPKLVKVPGRPNRLEGEIIWTYPAANCFVLPAITSPYHVIKIPKTQLDWQPAFIVRESATQCDTHWIPEPPPILK